VAEMARISIPTVRLLEQSRGTMHSWEKVLTALQCELRGRNLPSGATIGEQIAELRKRRKISQRGLARLCGLSQPTVWKLERHSLASMASVSIVLTVLGAGPVLIKKGESPAFFTHAATSSAYHGWETPRELMATLQNVFGRFHLDPCAPSNNKSVSGAHICYSVADDGLSLPWFGVVFLNPPYGRELNKWIEKARSEVAAGEAQTVVALVPARTDTGWWHDCIAHKAEVFFLRGRLRFNDGKQSAPFPSALVIWGGEHSKLSALKAALPKAWTP